MPKGCAGSLLGSPGVTGIIAGWLEAREHCTKPFGPDTQGLLMCMNF